MRKLLAKISSLFLRGHLYFNRRAAKKSLVPPRLLRYQPHPEKTKIFHFNGNFVIGGTSQLIADIVERTSDKYFHHIIVPYHPKPLPYQPLSISEFSLAQMPSLFEQLEKERPAFVHIHYWVRPVHRYFDFGLWYRAIFQVCEELKIKVIQNINVPTSPFESDAVVHNVFVSEYVRKQFNNSPIASSVIYPGSDLTHFTCPADHPFPGNSIGMVYRLDTDKLNPEAIEVFITVARKKPDVLCYIIGDGFYLDHYKSRVKEEGLENNFIFTGFISYEALPGYYKKMSLVIAPVHDESFGQVTPFAMSMGLPVVGYDTGALEEILGSKKTLVKFGDKDALATLAIDMINDPGKRKQAGRDNRERARQYFSVEKMISEYEYLYNSILS
ncbi:MAG: glycosyltransferase family 4 protein [Chitinophagaceae bacterium]